MPLPTPFHERLKEACLTYKWKDWAGYYAPCTYGLSPEREYNAIRQGAAMLDVTPLFKYEIRGPEAGAFLSRIMVREVESLKQGRMTYLCWCDDEGKVLDDGTCARLGAEHFRLTSGAPALHWLMQHGAPYDVRFEDVSKEMAALALQGPTSKELLRQVCDADMDALKFFGITPTKFASGEGWLSRTGYTGDLGYELWVPNDGAIALWDALIEEGKKYGACPVGLDALDISRIEAGFILRGIDYVGANEAFIDAQKSTPFEIGLGWTVKLGKREPFIGEQALTAEKERGSAWALVGLDIDWVAIEGLFNHVGLPPHVPSAAWRTAVPVYSEGRQIGRATSGAWSPTLKQNVALATVESEFSKLGTKVFIEWTVEWNRMTVPAVVSELPFFESGAKARMTNWDSIIIGGGHNGLVCAAYLAKAGRKVLVLERRHVLGGAAVTEEIYPGFKYSVCSYVVSLMRPDIIRELELPRFGMEVLPLECSFAPALDGPGLCRWPDGERTRSEIARYSKRDADRYPEFGRAMQKLARFAKPIIDNPAPDPASLSPTQLAQMLRFALPFRELGIRGLGRMMKMMTMSAVDFLSEWFESDTLKAPMSCSGIIGTYLGVRSPGTAYVLLHHYMGEIDGVARAWGFSKGGTGQISMAIARAAESYGAKIETNAAVAKLLTQGSETVGVVMQDGTEHRASTVVSSLDPHFTFFKLVDKKLLPDEMLAGLRRYRMRGSSGKVNLALDGLPEFTSRPGDGLHIRGDIAVAPSIAYLERAYDEAKYGAFSRRPYLNIVIPSLTDPSVAPPGKHILSAFVQYAPYHLAEGADAWPEKREAFGETVIDTIEELAPGFRNRILHKQVLTPWDLEKEFGLTEGNIFHGELSLEQLAFLRPVPGWAHYKTPVRGLWMCGSGTHPGGGLMGAPGKLAAMRMLKERAL